MTIRNKNIVGFFLKVNNKINVSKKLMIVKHVCTIAMCIYTLVIVARTLKYVILESTVNVYARLKKQCATRFFL